VNAVGCSAISFHKAFPFLLPPRVPPALPSTPTTTTLPVLPNIFPQHLPEKEQGDIVIIRDTLLLIEVRNFPPVLTTRSNSMPPPSPSASSSPSGLFYPATSNIIAYSGLQMGRYPYFTFPRSAAKL
jgi:hypothetical protein